MTRLALFRPSAFLLFVFLLPSRAFFFVPSPPHFPFIVQFTFCRPILLPLAPFLFQSLLATYLNHPHSLRPLSS